MPDSNGMLSICELPINIVIIDKPKMLIGLNQKGKCKKMFGNDREVRTLVDLMLENQASRTEALEDLDSLTTLTPDDVPEPPGGRSSPDSTNNTIASGTATSRKKASQTWPALVLPKKWPGNVTPTMSDDIRPAIGMVITEAEGEEGGSTGTAFAVSQSGHLLTCHHVIEGARSVTVRMEGSEGSEQARSARVLAASPECDIALLYLEDGLEVQNWQLIADGEEKVPTGQHIGLFSYPLGTELGLNASYSEGIINRPHQSDTARLYQIDVGAAAGSSGGPVFRLSDWTVIGVLRGGMEKLHGMLINFAVDIKEFRDLINGKQ
ncbi:MAG: trypsin-like peptidase domain-containing protein [Nitrospirae bacterium]|nr:trypsin-like peptidase domain-containing protein [Nitrospirota bacterium]